MKPRAVIYARVSTDEQVERGYGLPSQLRECRTIAAKRGYDVIGEFTDEGISGAILERPQLTAVRELVRRKGVDVVITHDVDRLSRNLVHQLVVDEECRRSNVRLEFCTYERRHDAEGLLFDQLKGCIAAYERVKIRERTSRGRREKANAGKIPGGPIPFGYRLAKESPCGIEIDLDEAAVVKLMFRWLVEGASVRGITKRLNTQGMKPRRGGRWNTSSVRKILTAETYAGTAFYDRRHYPDGPRTAVFRDAEHWITIKVPAIISRATWDRARAQFKRNLTIMSGHPGHRTYLLKGLVVCGGCGRRVHGIPSHGRRVYRCAGRNRVLYGDSCNARVRSAEQIEMVVWDAVTGVLRDPDELLVTVKTKKAALNAERVDASTELAERRRRLDRVQREQKKLLDLYLADHLDKDAYLSRDTPLKQAAHELTAQISQTEAQLAKGTADVDRHEAALRYCRVIRAGLDRLDEAGKQKLLTMLVDKVVLYPCRLEVTGILHTQSPDHPDGQESLENTMASEGRNRAQRAADRTPRLRQDDARPPPAVDPASADAGRGDRGDGHPQRRRAPRREAARHRAAGAHTALHHLRRRPARWWPPHPAGGDHAGPPWCALPRRTAGVPSQRA
jgi:site-specific DNA recombinase